MAMSILFLAIIGLGVLIIAVAVAVGHGHREASPRHGALADSPADIFSRERIHARAAARILGRHLADLAPGAKALAIIGDMRHRDAVDPLLDSLGEGLAEGLGEAAILAAVDTPDPPADDDEAHGDWDGIGSAAAFDALVRQHPACRLVVSFIGMPPDYSDMSLWADTPRLRPIIAVAQGGVPMLRNGVSGNALSAVVVPLPRTTGEAPPPGSDAQEIFDRHYLLVTPDNLESLATEHAALFAD